MRVYEHYHPSGTCKHSFLRYLNTGSAFVVNLIAKLRGIPTQQYSRLNTVCTAMSALSVA